MFVRTASARDLSSVRTLLVETWHATYDSIYGSERVAQISDDWHSLAALERNLVLPNSEFLVADDGKRLGGMAFAVAVDAGATVMLHQLYVLPACQGTGIGSLLLDEIEGCFPDAGKMRLEVARDNTQALAFYRGQGFAEVGQTENCGQGQSGISAVIFERPIMWAQ